MRPWPLLLLPLAGCIPALDDSGACAGPEVCNGYDDDCDGAVDEDVPDAPAWHPDADGDGYGDPGSFTIACDPPTGMVEEAAATDCDDGRADIHPGADETWYDGVDSDCDGASDYDQDGDGHEHQAWDGDDCDDEDAEIHPGAIETWYDGVDQDCDGADDYDQDGDGHDSDAYDGDDCDDEDPTVSPVAEETWYDGVDQDCDGADDYDQDGDGHQSDAYGGDDCDDDDPATYPGATEIWYDGSDSDCDGANDYDQDGDGHDHVDHGGDDCDDTDGAIHPGLIDWADDGVDQNCDGEVDIHGLGAAAAVLLGEAGGDEAGTSVAGVGDVNGDGLDDILVGAYQQDDGGAEAGVAYLLFGPVSSGSLGGADARLLGDSEDAYAGYALAAAGDVDGDGYADMLIGAPLESHATAGYANEGAAYLVLGPVSGDVSLSTAAAHLLGGAAGDGAGWAVAGGADLSGDGLPDLLVGASDAGGLDAGGTDLTWAGRAYVVDGTQRGETSLDSALALIVGDQEKASLGAAISPLTDTDGDGLADLAIGAPRWDEEAFEDVGAVYVFTGTLDGALSATDADTLLRGDLADDRAGSCLQDLGDLNSDGYGDLGIGAPDAHDASGGQPGRVYLLFGPWGSQEHINEAAIAVIDGPGDGANLCTMALPGDLNADGEPDLLLGAYHADITAADSGGAWLFLGPTRGSTSVASADAVFAGEASGDQAGISVAGAGDTDGDGYPDLLIGAPLNSTSGTDAGAAYLVLGSP
ncbi:MAG: MopE-related protein [Pseudomonadota bacterium]